MYEICKVNSDKTPDENFNSLKKLTHVYWICTYRHESNLITGVCQIACPNRRKVGDRPLSNTPLICTSHSFFYRNLINLLIMLRSRPLHSTPYTRLWLVTKPLEGVMERATEYATQGPSHWLNLIHVGKPQIDLTKMCLKSLEGT